MTEQIDLSCTNGNSPPSTAEQLDAFKVGGVSPPSAATNPSSSSPLSSAAAHKQRRQEVLDRLNAHGTAQSGYKGAVLREQILAALLRDGNTDLGGAQEFLLRWSTPAKHRDPNLSCKLRMSRFQTSGKIPPASQTSAIWPHVADPKWEGPKPTWYDIAAHGPDIHKVVVETVMAAAQSWYAKEVLLEDHEARIREEFGTIIRNRGGNVAPFEFAEKFAALDGVHDSPDILIHPMRKPTKEELRDWNEDLMKLGMPAEIVPVKIRRKERKSTVAPGVRYDADRYERGFHSDDEVSNPGFDRAADHITNYGVRKTKGKRPYDHEQRKNWYPWMRAQLNPDGLQATEVGAVEEVQGHPLFATLVALDSHLFHSGTNEEFAEKLGVTPNALTQRYASLRDLKERGMIIDRLNVSKEDWMKVMAGACFITVRLGNKDRQFILGPADMSHEDAKAAKRLAMEAAIARGLKEDTRSGLRGMPLKLRHAATALRIEQAFAESIVYERFSTPKGGQDTSIHIDVGTEVSSGTGNEGSND